MIQRHVFTPKPANSFAVLSEINRRDRLCWAASVPHLLVSRLGKAATWITPSSSAEGQFGQSSQRAPPSVKTQRRAHRVKRPSLSQTVLQESRSPPSHGHPRVTVMGPGCHPRVTLLPHTAITGSGVVLPRGSTADPDRELAKSVDAWDMFAASRFMGACVAGTADPLCHSDSHLEPVSWLFAQTFRFSLSLISSQTIWR